MKRVISLFCVLALALTMLCPATGALAAGESQKRVIDVVYDDSGSMCSEGDTQVDRWSQALYAMEIFATMLGSEDEMNVFLMSDSGANPVNVKGSDANRVEKIINALGTYHNTPFDTVRSAASHITSADSSAERWLVVLTDGTFNSNGFPSAGVQAALEDYAEQGINVVYLAIGSGAEQLDSNESIGMYAYSADSSAQILPCITEIANQIFQQQIQSASHITEDGDTMTLDVDIPLAQILVFAQGEDISVSSMELNGSTLTPTETHHVEVTADNKPENYPDTILADGLSGVVQTYTASGDPYASGTYTLTVSDTSNVEIYYIAGVDIDCLLTYNGVEVTADEKHYAGEYGISMRFLDPLTGEEVSSDLLDDAVFTATLTNGENVQEIDSSVTSVYLEEGEIKLEAVAELPGHVSVSSSRTYTVYPEPIQLDVSAQIPGEYKLSALGSEAEAILITVTNYETGEALSQEEWDAIGDNLSVSSDGNVNWLVQKGDDVGTWEIRPDYITDMSDTDSGVLELTVKAEYELGNQYASGAGVFSVTIMDYVASELVVEIVPPEDPIDIADMDGSEGALGRVDTKDEYTGEPSLLTQAQSETVVFTIQAEELEWTLEPTDQSGIWTLKPKDDATFAISKLETTAEDAEDIVVAITATLEDGMLYYQGADSEYISVIPHNILSVLIPGLIGGVIIFLLLGYPLKKKLHLKRFRHPRVTDKTTLNTMIVVKKRVLHTYLLPWLPQEAVFYCNRPAFKCSFPNVRIKAAGGSRFKIKHSERYASPNIKVDGRTYNAHDIKRLRCTAASRISQVDAFGTVEGEFRFS